MEPSTVVKKDGSGSDNLEEEPRCFQPRPSHFQRAMHAVHVAKLPCRLPCRLNVGYGHSVWYLTW